MPVSIGDDLDVCRQPVKEWLALYIGSMGARGRNFYNDYAVRLGYETEAGDPGSLPWREEGRGRRRRPRGVAAQ